MLTLVPTQKRPQIQDMRDTSVDEYALLQRIIEGDPAANPAQNLESENRLSCAFALLPPDQRAVIELIFYHGLPYSGYRQNT